MDFKRIRQLLDNVWKSISEKWEGRPRLLYTPSEEEVESTVRSYLEKHPGWVEYAIRKDPALLNKGEQAAIEELLTYQGLHAVAFHEKAHALYASGKAKQQVEARRISQGVRRITGGIEIHPGAVIGENFFIDHGAGVVIGETARIGNDVFLYHTVTLGATGAPKDVDNSDPTNPNRRHPKLGNNITIANGAQLLGPITVEDDVKIGSGARILGKVHIGKGATIAPGVEVREDVPAGAYVAGKLPELPGIIDAADAKAPIIRPPRPDEVGRGEYQTPEFLAASTKWRDTLAKAHETIAETQGVSR